jgi:hypothetical protein
VRLNTTGPANNPRRAFQKANTGAAKQGGGTPASGRFFLFLKRQLPQD